MLTKDVRDKRRSEWITTCLREMKTKERQDGRPEEHTSLASKLKPKEKEIDQDKNQGEDTTERVIKIVRP